MAAEVQAVTGLRVTAQNQKLEQVADWCSSCCVSPGSDKLGVEQKSRTNFAVDDAVIVSRVQSRAWEGRLTLHGDSCHVSPHLHPAPCSDQLLWQCEAARQSQKAPTGALARRVVQADRGLGMDTGRARVYRRMPHRPYLGVEESPVLNRLLERFRDRQSVNRHD